MIERLQRIATLLARFRLVTIALAGFFLVLLLLSVLDNPWLDGDTLLMPALIGFCWALTLYSTGEIFQSVPPRAGPGATLLRRIRLRLTRGLYWLLAVATVISAGALLFLSYQLIRVWL